MREDNSFFFCLSIISKYPGAYFGKKSLNALIHFWNGYAYRTVVEKRGKLDSPLVPNHWKNIENSESLHEFLDPNYKHFMDGFEDFAYSHYKHETYTTQGWANLISKNCNSEEEAFDKFFELLEGFFAQKGISMHPQEEEGSEEHHDQS